MHVMTKRKYTCYPGNFQECYDSNINISPFEGVFSAICNVCVLIYTFSPHSLLRLVKNAVTSYLVRCLNAPEIRIE